MASRAIWKGQLRLSLVAIPIELHSAVQSGARVSFRQIHGPSGKPVRYEKTVPGVGPVKSEDILKGYETGEGDYLLLDPEEVDAIRLETKKTLELVQFVDQCEIPPLYFEKPYYVVPTDELAEDAYRVVRDALAAEGKAALGQLAMRGREHLCAIRPCGGGLLLETLRYADELRKAEPMFASIEDRKSDPELLDVAKELIRRRTAPFDPAAFSDHYAAALEELIDAKRRNRKTPRARVPGEAETRPSGGNVVDLMSALKESLKKDRGGARPAKGGPKGRAGGGRKSGAGGSGAAGHGAKAKSS